MSNNTFDRRLMAARRAAWQVFFIGVGFQMLTYLLFLALGHGGMEEQRVAGSK